MLDRAEEYFYTEPGRITGPGRFLLQAGCFLFVAGAIGRIATGAINILPTLAKQPASTKTLADIYPDWPLWWVPETWIGAMACILMITAGVSLVLHGKQVDRILKAL